MSKLEKASLRYADLADAFPEICSPPELTPASREHTEEIETLLRTLVAEDTHWPKLELESGSRKAKGDTLEEAIGANPEHLFLLMSGEVEVVRTPSGRASPTILRLGRGDVVNAGSIGAIFNGRCIDLPTAPGPVRRWASCVTECEFFMLSPSTIFSRLKLPPLRRAFEERFRAIYVAHAFFEEFTASLRALPPLRRQDLSRLSVLLRGARYFYLRTAPIDVSHTGLSCRDDTNDGVYVTTAGGFDLRLRTQEHAAALVPWRAFNTFDIRNIKSLTPRGPTSAVFISVSKLREFFHSSEAFRRTVRQSATPDSPTWQHARAMDATALELVVLRGDRLETVEIADGVAGVLREYGDRVLRVSIRSGPGPLIYDADQHSLSVSHLQKEPTWGLVKKWVKAHLNHWLMFVVAYYDYAIVTSQGTETFNAGLQKFADTIVEINEVERFNELQRKSAAAKPEPEIAWDTTKVLRVYVADSTETEDSDSKSRHESQREPRRWVRVRRISSGGQTSLARRDLARLARAISGRMVGIALGGGGALGYSNIILLEELERGNRNQARPVPVDVVSGTSFGSIVGAYYSTAEHDEFGRHPHLDLLRSRAQRMKIQATTVVAMASSRAVRFMVNHDLKQIRVRDSIIRFLPFAVRAESLEPVIVNGQNIGEAVSASAAAPTAFDPVRVGEERFVDGAVIANVPSDVLLQAGCGLVVAMDPIPRSTFKYEESPQAAGPGRLMRWLDGLVPFGMHNRLIDGVRSFERVLAMTSEQSSQNADLSLKIQLGSILRMPFFFMLSDVTDGARKILDDTGAIARIQALYAQLHSPAERHIDNPDRKTQAALTRSLRRGHKNLADACDAIKTYDEEGAEQLRCPWKSDHERFSVAANTYNRKKRSPGPKRRRSS